jgi:protein-disulfide isomerase
MGRRARKRRPQKKPSAASRRLRLAGIVTGMAAATLAVVILIVLSQTLWASDGGGTSSQFIVPTPRPADIPSEGTTLGSPDAPLTIIEYSDFLCPYCRDAALQIVPQIEDEYIAAGEVKLVFKHFVVHGQEAVLAAGAAECASQQNAFWTYHDMLYLNAGSVDFSSENLKQFAVVLGLDTDSFNSCFDSQEYMDKLAADVDEARVRGVNSTPTFFVGQTELVGSKPYSDFKTAIDDELAKLGVTGETQ